jgi:hypothetical protein
MDRKVPTVSDLVRRAAEVVDPDDTEAAVGRLEAQLEDDDEPVTAVENLEERLALAAEGADYEIEDPAVSVLTAVVLYLADERSRGEGIRDPRELLRLAARSQWHRDPPLTVEEWLAARGVEL